MAEYRDLYEKIRVAGADVVGVSVDEPSRSAAVRQELQLPFEILCDTQRQVITDWGILNPREKGGIAQPAVFILDRDRRVRFASVDRDAARVPATTVVDFLLSGMQVSGGGSRRRWVIPRAEDFGRAVKNTFRFGMRSPRS